MTKKPGELSIFSFTFVLENEISIIQFLFYEPMEI